MGICSSFDKNVNIEINEQNQNEILQLVLNDNNIALLIFDIEVDSPVKLTHTELYIGGIIWGYSGGESINSGIYNYYWNNIGIDKNSSRCFAYKLRKIVIFVGNYDTREIESNLHDLINNKKNWRECDYNFLTNNCNCFTKTVLNHINPQLTYYFSHNWVLQSAINKNNIVKSK